MAVRRTIHKHEVVKRSLESIADYLVLEASLNVALRFLERAEEAFALILRSPGIGHSQEFRSLRLGGIRAWPFAGSESGSSTTARSRTASRSST